MKLLLKSFKTKGFILFATYPNTFGPVNIGTRLVEIKIQGPGPQKNLPSVKLLVNLKD